MEEIHEVIDKIERDILREMDIFLVIHMDPIEVNDKKVMEKIIVKKIIKELEPKASIHDFRIVNGEDTMNIIFDLVVPHSYSEKDDEEIKRKVMGKIKEVYKKANCIITVENSYIDE